MGTAIIYATGLTKHIKVLADYMAKEIKADIFNLKQITMINVTDFDTVIFGTGVSGNKPYKQITEFIEANRNALNGKRLVLFFDCKAEDEKTEATKAALSESTGISEVYSICTKGCEMNDAGIPVTVDEFLNRV